jgi:predicted transglutaminase-like cysteine proteinase
LIFSKLLAINFTSQSIAGKNIVIGAGSINIREHQLAKIPNEYAESLRTFSESISKQLKDHHKPMEEVNSINQSMNEFAKEVEDITVGKEQEIDYAKQTNIEATTAGVIQSVLNALPQAAETAATFTPLAPVSKLIGKGVEVVNAIQMKNSSG